MFDLDDQGSDQVTDAVIDDQAGVTVDDQSSQEPGGKPEDTQGVNELDQLRADLEETKRNYQSLQSEFTQRNQKYSEYERWQQEQARGGQQQVQQPTNQYGHLPPEDQAAMQQLDKMIEAKAQAMYEQKFGPIQEQVQTFQVEQELTAVAGKYPGFDRKAALEIFHDKSVNDYELSHLALLGRKYLAEQKARTDTTRKDGAKTVSGKSPASSPGQVRKYDPKLDQGKSAAQIAEDLKMELNTT